MRIKRRVSLLIVSLSTLFLVSAGTAQAYSPVNDTEDPEESVLYDLAISPSFTDVPGNHPYLTQISDLAVRGIIEGYGADLFGPDDLVKRQQFAKMIVRSLDLPVSEADVCLFGDVDDGGPITLYPDNYVAVCAQYGITIGKTSTKFDPYGPITRQQLITMVARAAGLPDPTGPPPPFSDGQFYPQEHYLNAWKAYEAGLLSGVKGIGASFDFYGKADRGEVCVLLYNMLHSPIAAEGIAIRAAIQASLGTDIHFLMPHLKISGEWAGAVITPIDIVADPLKVLLHKVGGVWTVVDYGTGYEAEDWIDQGAPVDLAEWLEGI